MSHPVVPHKPPPKVAVRPKKPAVSKGEQLRLSAKFAAPPAPITISDFGGPTSPPKIPKAHVPKIPPPRPSGPKPPSAPPKGETNIQTLVQEPPARPEPSYVTIYESKQHLNGNIARRRRNGRQ